MNAGNDGGDPPSRDPVDLQGMVQGSRPGATEPRSHLMPIPPRVSAVALRTADLARATAFHVGLGWELSPASTAAMSLFKTAGSLLLVCTDDLLAPQLGGPEVAAARAASRPARPSCRFT
jgi:hypothetical protein